MENCEEIQCPNASNEGSSNQINQETSTSTSSLFTKCSNSSVFIKQKDPPNIQHELNCAKAALQQCSAVSGENLFDHLSSIIKKVLQQRPEHVVEYFEEYSRNIREQKFNVPENFPNANYVDTIYYDAAENVLASIKAPLNSEQNDSCEENELECELKKIQLKDRDERILLWNERVLLSHFYWSLCGFGFQFDEVFHLSWVIQKLQYHPTIEHCRFWGKIHGLRKSYYVAEVTFTQIEIENRNEKYKSELEFKSLREPDSVKPITNPELIPGSKWQNCPIWELVKMQPEAAPIPLPILEEEFNIPPEPFGSGVNRRSYFVINSLTDEWIELPMLDVKQINVARKIRKYFSGDLEAIVYSYPRFPGCEKHYLRATIARITCGTYIAPDGFYRKQTKKDLDGYEMEGEEEEEENAEEDEKIDNDVVLLKNEKYIPMESPEIGSLSNWVHVRPNILDIQGRINFFDQPKAIRELLKKRKFEEIGAGGEEEEGEEEEEEEDEESTGVEVGPSIFSSCREDDSKSFIPAWTPRYSAVHNVMNQVMIMRSNLWPGSYSFASDKMADSIYLGWGHKYVSRNFSPTHIPGIQREYSSKPNLTEILDPPPELFFHCVATSKRGLANTSNKKLKKGSTRTGDEEVAKLGAETSSESMIELGV